MQTRKELYTLMTQILGPLERLPDAAKMEAGGFMALHLDVLNRAPHETLISLAHYYEQNGDLVPDPDMTFVIRHATHPELAATVEARSFQNLMHFEEVERDDGSVTAQTARLDAFALTWMRNLIAQGHRLNPEGAQ